MLTLVFKKLDDWVETENAERNEAGTLRLARCEIRVVGQTALLEANIGLHVPATMDVDVFANYEYVVKKKFEGLLKEIGKELDPVGHEAWMPEETVYDEFYAGKWIHAYLAQAEYVLISKAKKAPVKNAALLTAYLAKGPPEKFFKLAEKYKINLNDFVK